MSMSMRMRAVQCSRVSNGRYSEDSKVEIKGAIIVSTPPK